MRIQAALVLIAALSLSAGEKPRPPIQPAEGPGGADYAHAKVVEWERGKGDDQVWVFEPNAPRPATAPLVVFLHGWGGMLPAPYRAWIDHLVRKGNVVVYPRYQGTMLSPGRKFDRNVYGALKVALAVLAEEGHVHPELDHVAAVGHSFGASITVNYAAAAEREGLPQPKAILVVQPGNGEKGSMHMEIEDLSKIPAGTLVLVVAGEHDAIVGSETAIRYFRAMTAIPDEDRDFILVRSDPRGEPDLRATHFDPCAPKDVGKGARLMNLMGGMVDGREMRVDAYDWKGYWRWMDALCDAAFRGRNREFALGDTPEQRDMGTWSDGVRVMEPLVTDRPE